MRDWSVVAAGDREDFGLFNLGSFLLAGKFVVAPKMAVVEPRVESFPFQQSAVRAGFDDLSVVDVPKYCEPAHTLDTHWSGR